MDRVSFSASGREDRAGAISLDDTGRVFLRVNPTLAKALEDAIENPDQDLSPLQLSGGSRGLSLVASLARGLSARLVTCEFVSGSFEIRGFVDGGWARLRLRPGDFDPDAAWEFQIDVSDAKLEAASA